MKTNEGGVALITSLIIMMVIAVASAALIFTTTTQYRISRRNKLDKVAINLAEAGVDYAIWKLNNTGGAYSGTLSEGYTNGKPLGEGKFIVSVVSIGISGRLITSIGYSTNDEYQRTIKVRVEMAETIDPYRFAAFGSNKNVVSTFAGNVIIDSYNDTTSYPPGTNNGDIGSNSGIEIKGSVDVDGDAFVGPGNTLTGSVDGNVTVMDTYVSLPPIPSSETSKATQALSVGVNLNTGTYYYTEIDLSSGNITINGVVTIYVAGNISLKGNCNINCSPSTGDATKLFIYCAGSKVTLKGTGGDDPKIYGSIYAPDAAFSIGGNASLYGNIVANKIDAGGNAKILFDEDLHNLSKPSWWQYTSYVRVITSWERF